MYPKRVQLRLIRDSNRARTLKNQVGKQPLDHLPKLASLANWLSVHLQTKWSWAQVPLQSLNLKILQLFRARRSLTFRQLHSVVKHETENRKQKTDFF